MTTVLKPQTTPAEFHAGTVQPMSMALMFVVGRLYSEASGVTRIMCDLAAALERQHGSVTVYAALQNGTPTGAHLLRPPSRFVAEPGNWLGGLSWSPNLRRIIERDIGSFDVVHSHSLWMLPNHYASAAAHSRGKPVVFTAHGVFEPWAMARSSWKKRPVAWWWQNRDLHQAACIHVNSEPEVAGVRTYGLRNPVAIVPNGVDLAAFNNLPPRTALAERFPHLAGRKIILFLSRLHPKKGLAHLLTAWKSVAQEERDWHLVIAGRDDGAESATRAAIDSMQLQKSVTLTGVLEGGDKLAAFSAADVFVLPSFSEGFSMAILEAMAARLPVMLTPGCNFPQAVRAGAAIEVQPDASDTQRGLRQLIDMNDTDRRAMGQRGRALVESHYSWDALASQMMQLYRWMSGGGPPPGFVQS
jgi:poly(glycerol-phosphate) alpha-glucosyltransferase